MASRLTQTQSDIVAKTIDFVKNELATAEAGHDWLHIQRVYNLAVTISEAETDSDQFIVIIAALLHDIADSKFNGGDEDIGPRTAMGFLRRNNLDEEFINTIGLIIKNMSYKASLGSVEFTSHELQIVQDADRLDAIGAMGIARCFTYGGFKGRQLYNPDIKPNLNMTKEEYKNSTGPSINHFYEKLLLLKDTMNTKKGKELALQRHQFMVEFVEQFYAEIDGTR